MYKIKFLGTIISNNYSNSGCSSCQKKMTQSNNKIINRQNFIIPKHGRMEFVTGREYEVNKSIYDYLIDLTYIDNKGNTANMFEGVIDEEEKML